MRVSCVNYYKISRETAGYTQEQAAERLDISVRSLSAYENDEIIPPDDLVEKMVKLYNTKILGKATQMYIFKPRCLRKI